MPKTDEPILLEESNSSVLRTPLVIEPAIHTFESEIQHAHFSPQTSAAGIIESRVSEDSIASQGYSVTLPEEKPFKLFDAGFPASHSNAAMSYTLSIGRGIENSLNKLANNLVTIAIHPIDTIVDIVEEVAVTGWDGANAVSQFTAGYSTEGSKKRNLARVQAIKHHVNKFQKSDGAKKLEMGVELTLDLAGNIVTGAAIGHAVKKAAKFSTQIGKAKVNKLLKEKGLAIDTPHGLAYQRLTPQFLRARQQVEDRIVTLYRVGQNGVSNTAAGQFWGLKTPISSKFALEHGIPAGHVLKVGFVTSGKLKPGKQAITRKAPPAHDGSNPGGAVEVVTLKDAVQLNSYSSVQGMPSQVVGNHAGTLTTGKLLKGIIKKAPSAEAVGAAAIIGESQLNKKSYATAQSKNDTSTAPPFIQVKKTQPPVFNQGIQKLFSDGNRDHPQMSERSNKMKSNERVSQERTSENYTQRVFNQYHFDLNTLDAKTRERLDEIIFNFDTMQRAEKNKEQQAGLENGFANARETFSRIHELGQNSNNPIIASIGRVGEKGASIAYNFAHIAGAIPGIAAPTGVGLLLPGANIAVTYLALFSMLNNQDDGEDNSQVIFEKLKAISEQIKELHEEMRERLKHMDARLVKIHQDLLNGVANLQSIICSDLKSIKASLAIHSKLISEDIQNLQKLVEKGLIDIRLDDFKKIMSSLESYINGNLSKLDDAKTTLIRTTETLETNWLLENLSSDMFNNGWHYSIDEKNQGTTYRQIANISDYVLNKNVELIMGYLARFAKDTLKIPGIPVTLPNLELFSEGVKKTLDARNCLKERHHYQDFDVKGEQLQRIKTSATNVVQCIDALMKSPQLLFQPLFKIYTDGLKAMEEKAKQLYSEKIMAELKEQKHSLASIALPAIQPVAAQNDNPTLDVKHFSSKLNQTELSAIFTEARTWGIIDFGLNYRAERSMPVFYKFDDAYNAGLLPESCAIDAGLGHGIGPSVGKPTMPSYHIQMVLKDLRKNNAELSILEIDFKKILLFKSLILVLTTIMIIPIST